MQLRYIFLLIVLILASILRIHNLLHNPPGLFTDEASIGYDAYQILTTGRDSHNKPFPVFFESLGEYKDPVMIYSTIPFVAIFGLTEFSIRLVSAVYGIVTVVMLFLLLRKSTTTEVAVWGSILLSISPWHVHFSRIAFQLIAAVFWLIFGLYFLFKSFDSWKWYPLALLGWTLTFFSYSTTKMYLPLLVIFFIITHWQECKKLFVQKKIWVVTLFCALIVTWLIYPYITSGTFFARWKQVSEAREPLTAEFVLTSYANHFSPEFLFLKGDSMFEGQNVKRHSLIGLGEVFWFQFPFILIGIMYILLHKDRKGWFYLLFLMIYPLGTMFTDTIPQATRSILGVIPLQVVTGYGIVWFITLLDLRVPRLLINSTLFITVGLSMYLLILSVERYPLYAAGYWGWQYGYRDTLLYLKEKESEYDALYVTHRFNHGEYLLKFYDVNVQCLKCQVAPNPILINLSQKELFALRGEDITDLQKRYPHYTFLREKVITLPNGDEEIFIGTFRSS